MRLTPVAGAKLLDDNFFRGTAWEIGLKRFAAEIANGPLEIKLQPPRKDAPIYLPPGAWPNFGSKQFVGAVRRVEANPEYEVKLQIQH